MKCFPTLDRYIAIAGSGIVANEVVYSGIDCILLRSRADAIPSPKWLIFTIDPMAHDALELSRPSMCASYKHPSAQKRSDTFHSGT